MLNSQLFAKCVYLWPSSFLSSLPLSKTHRRIVLSSDLLMSCDRFVGLKRTQLTSPLPLSQMSALLVTVLRLSPAERGARRQNRYFNGFAYAMAQNKQRYLRPSSVVRHLPDSTSQILRSLSEDFDMMVSPLGENSQTKTPSLPFF
jgi:hypothetical protein